MVKKNQLSAVSKPEQDCKNIMKSLFKCSKQILHQEMESDQEIETGNNEGELERRTSTW